MLFFKVVRWFGTNATVVGDLTTKIVTSILSNIFEVSTIAGEVVTAAASTWAVEESPLLGSLCCMILPVYSATNVQLL